MPSFEKSPPELVARFDGAAERFPAAQRRKMFGYPALFVGGNLVTGLFADSWMIRRVRPTWPNSWPSRVRRRSVRCPAGR